MKRNLTALSECEEQIMCVIWDYESPPDLHAVLVEANRRYYRDWQSQTVSTFLTRIRQKGYVTTYKVGRYTYYSPVVGKEMYREEKTRKILDGLYGGRRELMIQDIM